MTFVAGSATATISIPIFGNGVYNYPDLTFSVQLLDYLPQVTFATGKRPISVAVGDINGDGKPDLVISNYLSNTLSVLLNTTAPGAVTPSLAGAQQTFASRQGAVCRGHCRCQWRRESRRGGRRYLEPIPDGTFEHNAGRRNHRHVCHSDTRRYRHPARSPGGGRSQRRRQAFQIFAVANGGDTTASLFLNTTPTGAAVATFAPTETVGTGRLPAAIAISDVNGDGKLDLIVATGDRIAYVYLNTTTPGGAFFSFTGPKSFETSPSRGPVYMAVGDLNGDGKPDLAFADDVNYASVLSNATGPGASVPAFGTSATFEAGNSPASVAIADVNGDGKPDLDFRRFRRRCRVGIVEYDGLPGAQPLLPSRHGKSHAPPAAIPQPWRSPT